MKTLVAVAWLILCVRASGAWVSLSLPGIEVWTEKPGSSLEKLVVEMAAMREALALVYDVPAEALPPVTQILYSKHRDFNLTAYGVDGSPPKYREDFSVSCSSGGAILNAARGAMRSSHARTRRRPRDQSPLRGRRRHRSAASAAAPASAAYAPGSGIGARLATRKPK